MAELDTIVAISTAPGRSALAVVRVSGPLCGQIAFRLGARDGPPRTSVLTRIRHPETGDTVDRVLAVRFEGPASYTGEDMLEFSCHGGALVPHLVLDAVCASGARPAAPGEFTRRAYLNGRIDLLQAEATLDLIDARSGAMHQAALFQLERGLSRRIERLRMGLLELQSLLAYDIDFPEEDEGPVAPERIDAAGRDVLQELERMLELAPEAELLREGALTVIAGRPNTGKSSLFNALLGIERAIVTEEPGTTRDAIEAVVSIRGYPFRLVDTAGLRESAGRVEGLGIEVAKAYLERADLILLCVEAGRDLGLDERQFIEQYEDQRGRLLVLRTKADLESATRIEGGAVPVMRVEETAGAPVSAHTGAGIAELRECLLGLVFSGLRQSAEVPLVTRGRHVRCLRAAEGHMNSFAAARSEGRPPEIAATHVQDATLALEDLVGVVTTEDLLDAVFSEFCVGK